MIVFVDTRKPAGACSPSARNDGGFRVDLYQRRGKGSASRRACRTNVSRGALFVVVCVFSCIFFLSCTSTCENWSRRF